MAYYTQYEIDMIESMDDEYAFDEECVFDDDNE
jgi:hypothetical protein